MNNDNNILAASVVLLLQYLLPIIAIAAIIAIISIDHRLKQIEKHFEQLSRSITKYIYDNSNPEQKTEYKKTDDVSNEMPSISLNETPNLYQSTEPWACVFCGTRNNASDRVCKSCGKNRFLQ